MGTGAHVMALVLLLMVESDNWKPPVIRKMPVVDTRTPRCDQPTANYVKVHT